MDFIYILILIYLINVEFSILIFNLVPCKPMQCNELQVSYPKFRRSVWCV